MESLSFDRFKASNKSIFLSVAADSMRRALQQCMSGGTGPTHHHDHHYDYHHHHPCADDNYALASANVYPAVRQCLHDGVPFDPLLLLPASVSLAVSASLSRAVPRYSPAAFPGNDNNHGLYHITSNHFHDASSHFHLLHSAFHGKGSAAANLSPKLPAALLALLWYCFGWDGNDSCAVGTLHHPLSALLQLSL